MSNNNNNNYLPCGKCYYVMINSDFLDKELVLDRNCFHYENYKVMMEDKKRREENN
jgi:hypothetical protein